MTQGGEGFSDTSNEDAGDPDLILFGGSPPEQAESIQSRALAISDALGNVGLHDADRITERALKPLGRDILASLNPFTAESVYFNLVRRTRRWLGNEQIYPKEFINQVRFVHGIHGNLEVFQLRQRHEALDYLYKLGFDTDQLLSLLGGSESEQQSINRLGFLLMAEPPIWERLKPSQPRIMVEPRLRTYIVRLLENAELDGPWNVETVVIEAQESLKKELKDISDRSTDEDKKQWDSVTLKLYERMAHRLGSSIMVGHVILHSLRNNPQLPHTFPD